MIYYPPKKLSARDLDDLTPPHRCAVMAHFLRHYLMKCKHHPLFKKYAFVAAVAEVFFEHLSAAHR